MPKILLPEVSRAERGAFQHSLAEPGGLIPLLGAVVARLFTATIRLYQWIFSPWLGRRCIYSPSCSDYAIEAICGKGPWRGLLKALWRILRCNPFSRGGFDPP